MMQLQDPRKHAWGRVLPFPEQSIPEEMFESPLCPFSRADSENYKMATACTVLISKQRREIKERLKEHSNKTQTTYSSQTAYSTASPSFIPPRLWSCFLLLDETRCPSPFSWSKSPEAFAPTDGSGGSQGVT